MRDALVDVGHLQGQVDDAVAVVPVVVQHRAVRGDPAGEDEAGAARAQHVGLGVAQAGLRAAVGLEVHAERELVEGRGLRGVAHQKPTASIAVTGKGLLASYSTRPTSSLSWSRVRSARISSGVSHHLPKVSPQNDNLRNSGRLDTGHIVTVERSRDDLDRHMIICSPTEPRVGVLEASRRLGVARGTVQARLDRLESARRRSPAGDPDLAPEALGFPVTAFLTLEISQATSAGGHAPSPTTSRRSPRSSRRSPSPVPATCGAASSRARTPTCSGSSTRVSSGRGIHRALHRDRPGQPRCPPGAAAAGDRSQLLSRSVRDHGARAAMVVEQRADRRDPKEADVSTPAAPVARSQLRRSGRQPSRAPARPEPGRSSGHRGRHVSVDGLDGQTGRRERSRARSPRRRSSDATVELSPGLEMGSSRSRANLARSSKDRQYCTISGDGRNACSYPSSPLSGCWARYFSIFGIATKTGHQARTFQGLLILIPIRKTTTSSRAS